MQRDQLLEMVDISYVSSAIPDASKDSLTSGTLARCL